MNAYSLYIHIPFCAKKCNYCDFTSYEGVNHLIPQYVSTLKNELSTYSAALESPVLKSIYFGGGTPSILHEKEIGHLLEHIYGNFSLREKAEISIEVNPGTVNLGKLLSYKKSGINRISIGAQSFNDAHLRNLGRIHTSSQATYTFNAARTAGFRNINIDLIFALPSQDVVGWGDTLKKTVSLGPEHISTYNLVIEEGTPFHTQKHKLPRPTEDEESLMFEDAILTLTSNGYHHYEISNFARPGHQCANNLTYWQNEEYIGVGAGATSYIASSRYSNPASIKEYASEWEDPHGSILEQKHGSGRQDTERILSETIFLGLRLRNGINLSELKDKFGDVLNKYGDTITELLKQGLLEYRQPRLKLSRRGLFLANEGFERFV